MTDILQTPNKLFNKKKRQINKSKWKTNIKKISLRKAIITSLKSFDKKLESKTKEIDIAMISANAYCAAYY